MMIRNKTLAVIGIYLSLLLFVFTFTGVEILHYSQLHDGCAHLSAPARATDTGRDGSCIETPPETAGSGICPICSLLSHVQPAYRSLRCTGAPLNRPQILDFFFEGIVPPYSIAASIIPRGPPAFSNHNLSV